MRVIADGGSLPPALRGGVVAIGNFDGVHCGHQALIARALDLAQGNEVASPVGVVVFEPHPREFFVPEAPHFRITPLPEKLRLLEKLGLDFARVLTFDAALSQMSPAAFIDHVLVADLGIKGAVAGYDFFFGHRRQGTPEMLIEAGAERGFSVEIVAPVADRGEVFSSSAVRLKLAEGDIAGANAILGRPWRVTGTVVGGAKRGTGMGYPTANVPMPKGTTLAHGIFAVRLQVGGGGPLVDGEPVDKKWHDRKSHDGEWHDGAAYLGTRPTFDDGKPVLEVFVLDFDGDLYGRQIAVEFAGFIRPDRKFDNVEALVAQMDLDVAAVRTVLAATG
ncbi:MAG: bifunctional riboflavin kinase/FAD synthetase [Hyphomicrobium aestuarii]|nr:bifunctional riboflavin kinase/FAD synthetase [Hyphomicrobium aestuarii]